MTLDHLLLIGTAVPGPRPADGGFECSFGSLSSEDSHPRPCRRRRGHPGL